MRCYLVRPPSLTEKSPTVGRRCEAVTLRRIRRSRSAGIPKQPLGTLLGNRHTGRYVPTLLGRFMPARDSLDHEAYLRAVLERIADHPINRIDDLLPWRISVTSPRSTAQTDLVAA